MPDGNVPSSGRRVSDHHQPLDRIQALFEEAYKVAAYVKMRTSEALEANRSVEHELGAMDQPFSSFSTDPDPSLKRMREATERFRKTNEELQQISDGILDAKRLRVRIKSLPEAEQQEAISRLQTQLAQIKEKNETLEAQTAEYKEIGRYFKSLRAELGDSYSGHQKLGELVDSADLAAARAEGVKAPLNRIPEIESGIMKAANPSSETSIDASNNTKEAGSPYSPSATEQRINDRRSQTRDPLVQPPRAATRTEGAEEAPAVVASSHEELAFPLQSALEEVARKSPDEANKETATAPEKPIGEPTAVTKETIDKPPLRETNIPAVATEAASASTQEQAQDKETKRPLRDLDSAAIASAIQETLKAETQQERETSKDTSTAASGSPLESTVSRSEQQTINEARAELKGKYAERKRDAEILTLYGERMSTRSWEYLQTHDATRYGQLQIAQASIPNLTIDASIFLTTEERQAVHLAATVDVRASHPEVTDERLSSLLLSQAQSLLRVEQAGVAAGMAATLAIAGVLAGTQAAQVATAGATSAVFAALYQQIGQTQAALAQEEQHSADRAQIIKIQASAPSAASGTGGGGTGTTSAGRGGQTTLQSQQRQGLDTRRGLQAALHAQIQQAMAGSALGEALAQAGALSSAQAQAANGLLAFILPTNLRPTADAGRMNGSDGRDILRSGDAKEATENTTDASDRSDYEAGLAAKLAAQQLQDRRFQGSSQTKGSTGGSIPSSALLGNDGNPLLDANRTRPLSPQEIFTRKQAAMRKRTDDFAGIGQEASGYEAAFGEAGAALPNAGADVIEVQDGDLIPVGGTVDGEPTTESLEEARVQELLQRQQQERAAQSKESKLDQLKKLQNLKNNPLANQAKGQALKLLGTPLGLVAILVVAFVVIIWLNIRLFFSDEESSWRKPLGTWGMVGTLALDLFAVINVLFSFILLVILCIIPFIPGLLAAGGIFATLQAAFRLFGG